MGGCVKGWLGVPNRGVFYIDGVGLPLWDILWVIEFGNDGIICADHSSQAAGRDSKANLGGREWVGSASRVRCHARI